MDTISVVIATYGEWEWEQLAIDRAWPSVINESEDGEQILCFHDPDGTRASSLNHGAKRAEGDWLIFLDADDELAPGYVGAMRRALEQHNDGNVLLTPADVESDSPAMAGLGTERRAVAGQAEAWVPPLFTPSVQQVRKGRPGAPFFFPEVDLAGGNWLVIGTMINRQFFLKLGGFHEHPHGLEDWNLWNRAVRAGAKIVKVPDAVYRAYVNPRSEHHRFQRDRRAYMAAYEIAKADV